MKRLLLIFLLLAVPVLAGDYLGVFINSNGWSKAQSDQTAAALREILGDTAPVDFMALPIAHDPPANKRFYVVWADGTQIKYFKDQSVYAAKADMDVWLASAGAIKNFVTIIATNAASALDAEAAAGYWRQTNGVTLP